MTKEDYTAVVLVVDRSGSMSDIAGSVQEALEEFVGKQIHEPGELTIDTLFFDDKIEERAHLVDPKKESLDLAVNPRGMTALYDAVGLKIRSFGEVLSAMDEEDRPHKVIFVIATDGHENSSREFTQEALAKLIGDQREKYGWDFTFIGANQDAILTAKTLNIPEGSAITFEASATGVDAVLRGMSGYVAAKRAGAPAAYSEEVRAQSMAKDATPKEGRKIPLIGGRIIPSGDKGDFTRPPVETRDDES